MKKKISVTGKNGTFEGYIHIELNQPCKEFQIANGKKIETIVVSSSVRSTLVDNLTGEEIPFGKDSSNLEVEAMVSVVARVSEIKLKEHLNFLANDIKVVTISDKLKNQGYK